MTPAEAVAELARGLKDPDEVAKRLWEAGVLMPSKESFEIARTVDDVIATYCPISRYIYRKTGVNAHIRVGVTSWTVRGGPKGNLPRVLRDFVQHYDNGDYDNLTSEEARV